jgi:K+-transporting ATPase c subunit
VAFTAVPLLVPPFVAPLAFTAVHLLVPPFVAPLAFTAVHLLVLPSHLVGSLVAAKDRQLNYEDDGTPLCMS